MNLLKHIQSWQKKLGSLKYNKRYYVYLKEDTCSTENTIYARNPEKAINKCLQKITLKGLDIEVRLVDENLDKYMAVVAGLFKAWVYDVIVYEI